MQSAKPNQGVHPMPIDRNKAIIWARYLIDSTDWLLFGTRVTYLNNPEDAVGQKQGLAAPKLVSMAVLTPEGKVVYEAMLKTDEIVPNNLIAAHGLDYAVVFNSKQFSEINLRLAKITEGKQILTWDLSAVQILFDELCVEYAQPALVFTGHSLRDEYAKFVGEVDNGGKNYKLQELKCDGNSAVAQCRAVLDALYRMASSNQITNTASTGNQGWTGEFYKPKISTADKIKDFLGL